MSYFEETTINAPDSASLDATLRWRTSTPEMVFDSKFLNDLQPSVWNTNAAGSASTSFQNASAVLSAINPGDSVSLQTRIFTCTPGKSYVAVMTGLFGNGDSGVTERLGYFDDSNGLYFGLDNNSFVIGYLNNSTNTMINQSNWNLDSLDGTGPSGITLDYTKIQNYVIEFDWQAGQFRFGVIVKGTTTHVHNIDTSNSNTLQSLATPNLPLRAQVQSTGGNAQLQLFSASIVSEGARGESGGMTRSIATSAVVGTTSSAILTLQRNAIFNSATSSVTIDLLRLAMVATTSDAFSWQLVYNGTFSGQNFNNVASDSAASYDTSGTFNNDGTVIDSGYGVGALTIDSITKNSFLLGNSNDTFSLVVQTFSSTLNVHASFTWRELS